MGVDARRLLGDVVLAYGGAVLPYPFEGARRVEGLRAAELYVAPPDVVAAYVLDSLGRDGLEGLDRLRAEKLVRLAPARLLAERFYRLPPSIRLGWYARLADALGPLRVLPLLTAGRDAARVEERLSRDLSELAGCDTELCRAARRAAAGPGVLYSPFRPVEPLPLYLASEPVRPVAGTLSWRLLEALAAAAGWEGDLRLVEEYVFDGRELAVTLRAVGGQRLSMPVPAARGAEA